MFHIFFDKKGRVLLLLYHGMCVERVCRTEFLFV